MIINNKHSNGTLMVKLNSYSEQCTYNKALQNIRDNNMELNSANVLSIEYPSQITILNKFNITRENNNHFSKNRPLRSMYI